MKTSEGVCATGENYVKGMSGKLQAVPHNGS